VYDRPWQQVGVVEISSHDHVGQIVDTTCYGLKTCSGSSRDNMRCNTMTKINIGILIAMTYHTCIRSVFDVFS